MKVYLIFQDDYPLESVFIGRAYTTQEDARKCISCYQHPEFYYIVEQEVSEKFEIETLEY